MISSDHKRYKGMGQWLGKEWNKVSQGKGKKKIFIDIFFPADSFPTDEQGGKYKVILGSKWGSLYKYGNSVMT